MGTARILVADDSALARLSVTRRLRSGGFDVIEAASAMEATADAPGAQDFACALLDLDLGDGDGATVAQALRDCDPAIPIAFFSASATGEVMVRARAIGPVFAKPQDLDAAIAWIEQNAR
jgi:CheY-like chemotaxis protein